MNLIDNDTNAKLTKQDLNRQKRVRENDQSKLINDWLVNVFGERKTAAVSFHLNRKAFDHPGNRSTIRGNDWIIEDVADKIARRFSKSLNRHFYGKSADRHDRTVRIIVCLHNDNNPHLHIIAEVLDERGGISALKEFADEFCIKSFNTFKDILPKVYVDETFSVKRSLSYNNDNDKARGGDLYDGKIRDWDFYEGAESIRLVVL